MDEQRFLKDLIPERAEKISDLAPEPVMVTMKSFGVNTIEGIDPASGRKIITIVFTAGNFSQQHMYMFDTLLLASFIKMLSAHLGPNGEV